MGTLQPLQPVVEPLNYRHQLRELAGRFLSADDQLRVQQLVQGR